ncbi:unnamed protein product [Prorocentrum cordatum]|uniref:Uncharacterized protein n=1 Tax=Prorocentrum cordatum TaxID=2364126 RepID=A0ABN9UDP0_9DINO|nr:unnamed protein product [Polarella glacialis]
MYPRGRPLGTDAAKPQLRPLRRGRLGRPCRMARSDNGGGAPQLEPRDAALSSCCGGEQAPPRRVPSAVPSAWQLELVDCGLEGVLSAQPGTSDGHRSYPGPGVFFSLGEPLCTPTEVAPPPSTLYGVYLALLGEDSRFRHRLCDGVNPEVAEVRRLQSQPGCGTARARCLASIPVLGKRTYQETLRIALCRDGGVSTLAIQVAGTLKVGFPVGDFLTETLHLFTQAGDDCPVQLQSWGMAQPGAQQRKALDGMKAKHREYLANVRRAVREALPGSLQARPHAAPSTPPSTPSTRASTPSSLRSTPSSLPSAPSTPAGAAPPSWPRPAEGPPAEAEARRRAGPSWQECLSGGCLAGLRRAAAAPEGLLLMLMSLLLDLV